jgi:hypothetical protein
VLPFEDSRPNLKDVSGVEYLTEGGGFVEEDYRSVKSQESEDEVPSSIEVVEAKKLIALNVEMGVKFNDGDGEDVARMMGLEARDKAEKIDWEKRGGYQ